MSSEKLGPQDPLLISPKTSETKTAFLSTRSSHTFAGICHCELLLESQASTGESIPVQTPVSAALSVQWEAGDMWVCAHFGNFPSMEAAKALLPTVRLSFTEDGVFVRCRGRKVREVSRWDGDELGCWQAGGNRENLAFDDYIDALMPPAEFLALGAASHDFKLAWWSVTAWETGDGGRVLRSFNQSGEVCTPALDE